jgi:FtsZ-binding cell division protein ZapB
MILPPARRYQLFLLPSLLLAATLGAAPDTDPIEPGEKAASEWIRTRLETTRIEGEWTTDRPLLESTVNGLKERAQSLEEKRDLLRAKTAKDREDTEALESKNKAATDDLNAVGARLQTLVGQLGELRASLPPRLSEALDLSYRSLASTSLTAGERMQLAMTILNRCSLFNRTVTCGEEVLTVDGETGATSLDVIYWGLSHGYALDRAAGKAWYGSPGPHGWRWQPATEAARPIARLIAIYNDKADPDFVSVPAMLGQPMAEGSK